MMAILGTVLLFAVAVMEVLLIFGLPLGEFTMGGRYKVWPRKLRPVAASQLAVQIFALYILLAASGTLPCFISENVTKIICFVFTVFFLGNTVMNFFSTSKKEKYIMTPMSAVSSICFLLAGLGV